MKLQEIREQWLSGEIKSASAIELLKQMGKSPVGAFDLLTLWLIESLPQPVTQKKTGG